MLKCGTVFSVLAVLIASWLAGQAMAAQESQAIQIQPDAFAVPEMQGVTCKVISTQDGKVLSVVSEGVDKPIVIDLGWLPAKPDMKYLFRYRVRGESLEEDANLYLMIREHEAKNVRPITPYHKTSVRYRPLPAASKGAWMPRSLTVQVGGKTNAFSGSIVIAALKGEIHISAVELIDSAAAEAEAKAQAQADYEQLLEEVRSQAAARTPLTERTLVFSRSQMKYGLERNYDHVWIDRPLFVNRAYRVPQKYMTPLPSYKRILEEVVQYDIDGLAFFPETKGRMGIFELHEQAGVEGVGLLPEFLPAYGGKSFEPKLEILQRALKSPHAPRVNGKLLITSYAAEAYTPEKWDELLSALRERVGDTFVFLPTLTNVVALSQPFNAGEPITRAEIEKAKAHLRRWLDVCDGIYFNYPAAFRNADHTFNAAFYREIFVPVFKSVLSEPAYRNKYLGLSAYKSHMNADRTNSLHEDGTRTLRASFEIAMQARPDVIILPEWDEFNENTCFRPTIYGSTSTQRILRYYMSKIKSKAPTPVPGDDMTMPNLILSTRKIVTLGEDMMIELLNVPDAAEGDSYVVELELQDEAGNTVHRFDAVTFDAAELQEHRFYLATEDYADVRAFIPVLKIRGYKGHDLEIDHGLHHVQVRATWNWDFLYVKQPVREVLQPTTAKFAWEEASDETANNQDGLVLAGHVDTPEELALVEVLADDDVVYAVDPRDEYFRDDMTRELVLIEYRSVNTVELEGTVILKNGAGDWLAKGTVLHQAETATDIRIDRVELRTPASLHERWIRLAIPRSDIADAELEFDFNLAKFTVPVREVFEKQMIARGFENGLHFTVSPYRKQIDMPYHLEEKQASFRVRVWPEIATEQYHLRVTTTSGKVYRSRPVLIPGADSQPSRVLRVYSDRQQGPVDVSVAADRVPELVYDFAPERGAVLLTDAGRPFWATLGGYTSTTTGRGASPALLRNYPEQVNRSAPEWVLESGQPSLAFDGIGTYMILPREAMPWRGAFTLSFEVKPGHTKDQVLLFNRVLSNRQMGLKLEIRSGQLWASYRNGAYQFPTEFAIPAGRWSAVTVRYDLENLTLGVDGHEASFPLAGPASNVGFTVIGDGGRGKGFVGQLRNLRIVHGAN